MKPPSEAELIEMERRAEWFSRQVYAAGDIMRLVALVRAIGKEERRAGLARS